jgi:hypothetical protein
VPSRATRAIAVIVSGPVTPGAGLRSVGRLVGRQATSSSSQQAKIGGLCLRQVVIKEKAASKRRIAKAALGHRQRRHKKASELYKRVRNVSCHTQLNTKEFALD